MSDRFALAVHGGAGRVPAAKTREPGRLFYDAAMARGLEAGAQVLGRGGTALDAVVAAVVVLEDDEHLNAARGAALCADGSVELSASVMDGESMAVGAMVGLTRVKNPIRAARALVGHSHCLLFGSRGDAFAHGEGLEIVPTDYFVTPRRRRQWERLRDREGLHLDHSGEDEARGTVGAVARDRGGGLAAATSTGGMVNQWPGRVGDSPVTGAGTWASNVCAVSATGTGDPFFRLTFARRVADLIELAGLSPEAAALRALGEVGTLEGEGGCILVDGQGRLAMPMSSPQMIRGWLLEGDRPRVAILADEVREAPAPD